MPRDYSSIRSVLIITFLLNLVATSAKLIVGFSTGALSLIADGLDTLFDGVGNIVALIAIRIGSQPPDEEHPYGHRKYETLAALFIAAALFISAWEVGRGAVERFLAPEPVEVNQWSIAALIFGSIVQGFTGWWEMRQARKLQSEVLMADARHTLTSIGVSAAVLIGLALVWLGLTWADPLVALLVAVVIAKIGVDTVAENVPALVDRAPLDAERIGEVVAGVRGVESYHRIRSRGPADKVAIDLHVRVAPHLSMQDANAIADEVRRRLLALPGVDDVTVHVEAQRGPESATDLYTATNLAAQELGLAIHEWWVQTADGQLSMHLHVGVDPTLTIAKAHELVDQLEQRVQERLPEIKSIHSHIELASPEILPSAYVSSRMQQHIDHQVRTAAESIPQIGTLQNIQTRQVEGKLFITLDAQVDGRLSVTEAHELSTRLQEAIRAAVPNVGEALVHLEPDEALSQPVRNRNVTR